jgi:hypothetical protein
MILDPTPVDLYLEAARLARHARRREIGTPGHADLSHPEPAYLRCIAARLSDSKTLCRCAYWHWLQLTPEQKKSALGITVHQVKE